MNLQKKYKYLLLSRMIKTVHKNQKQFKLYKNQIKIKKNKQKPIYNFKHKNTKMKYMSNGSDAGQDKITASQSAFQGKRQIDWNDYTYPPCSCIQMFHYVYEETPEMYRRRTILLKINHIAIIAALLLNFLTNIIGAAQDVQDSGIRIAISIFVFLIWLPISFYLFIMPYQIMLGGDGSPLLFYILSLVAIVWFFIWSIADFADANGFIMVSKNFDEGKGGAGFFGLITAILMMGISLLALVNTILFYKR